MGVEKRKSNQNAGSPTKQARPNPSPGGNFGKSPGGGGKFGKPGGGGGGGGKPFGKGNFGKGPGGGGKFGKGGGGGGKPQQDQQGGQKKWNKEGGSPGGQSQSPSPPKQVVGKGEPAPPAPGAKKIQVQVVKPEGKNQKKHNNKMKGKKNGVLNKVSDQSKPAFKKTPKKNRFQRLYTKLDLKVRSPGECERAQKAEQELVHSGRAFTVKVSDPPITQDVVKSWSTGIETAVFTRPVEPRQFLIIFKHNANIKKELDSLKKQAFAGGKLQVEEKIDRGSEVGANPEAIDPYSLYISNLHETVTKESLGALFPKATTVTPPRKHNPKLGSSTKFSFIAFDSAEDALSSFKENYQAVLSGNSIVMRFRRVAAKELHHIKEADTAKVATPQKPVTPKSPAAKKEPVKVEPQSDEDDEEDDDDDDDDDEEVDAEEAGSDDEEDDDDDDDDEDDNDDDDDDDEDED